MVDPVREGTWADRWQERIWPRRHAGPLAVVMVELIDWLVAQGYAPTTQRNHVRAASRLGSWMDAEGVELDGVDAECVSRLVREDNERHREHRSANENISAVLRFLGEAGRLKPSPLVAETRLRPAQACLAWPFGFFVGPTDGNRILVREAILGKHAPLGVPSSGDVAGGVPGGLSAGRDGVMTTDRISPEVTL